MPNETIVDSSQSFDAEHTALFRQIDIIRTAFNAAHPNRQAIVEQINTLYTLAKAHFLHEEAYLLSTSNNELASHKRDHEYALRSLSDYIAQFIDAQIAIAPGGGDGFLSWMNLHINKYDTRAGVAESPPIGGSGA